MESKAGFLSGLNWPLWKCIFLLIFYGLGPPLSVDWHCGGKTQPSFVVPKWYHCFLLQENLSFRNSDHQDHYDLRYIQNFLVHEDFGGSRGGGNWGILRIQAGKIGEP